MEITLNEQQRLYVINNGGGYSCLGFDNCFRDAVQLAELMNKVRKAGGPQHLAPSPEMIGTMECYKRYRELLNAFAQHPASKNTWYSPGTPAAVKRVLEEAIKAYRTNSEEATILRVFYGDPQTGRDWCEENDTVGFIGRTGGIMKAPILLEPLRGEWGQLQSADGGGAIVTNRIVRIIDVTRHEEVYRAPNYQLPRFTTRESGLPELPVAVFHEDHAEGKQVNCANCSTFEEAAEYIAFLQGFRTARPFRTTLEFAREMRQAA